MLTLRIHGVFGGQPERGWLLLCKLPHCRRRKMAFKKVAQELTHVATVKVGGRVKRDPNVLQSFILIEAHNEALRSEGVGEGKCTSAPVGAIDLDQSLWWDRKQMLPAEQHHRDCAEGECHRDYDEQLLLETGPRCLRRGPCVLAVL